MPSPTPIPERFLTSPFHRHQLVAAGISPKVLLGRRFERVFPAVWKRAGLELDHPAWLDAADLALTDRAHLSHVSRIQRLGLDIGPERPYRFTVQGDLHIAIPGIFLHRTEVLPPLDDDGVTPGAAFVQCCDHLRLLDLIVIGDWLLHRGHTTMVELRELARMHEWRPGALEVELVLPYLDERSASPPESQLRAYIVFSALGSPEVNADVFDDRGARIAIVDLLLRAYQFAFEFEGRQHADSVQQFARDIGRYADLRAADIEYMQVTYAMLQHPRALILGAHQRLVARGYAGPPPVFGPEWESLFRPLTAQLRCA